MVYAINGQIPGPEIIVTEGDMVSIKNIKTNRMTHLKYVFDIGARKKYFDISVTRQQPYHLSCMIVYQMNAYGCA